jgi:hypothetical protein
VFGTWSWTVALGIGAVYLVLFAQLTSFPFQDYPNHVARGVVMADLLFQHGAHFGADFAVHLMVVPYILGDLVMATCVHLLGAKLGPAVFTALVLLSLPCALLFYMSVNRVAPRARPLIFLLGLYLATDWFFLRGFVAFRLSIAAIIVTLALANLLRRHWSAARYAAYAGALVLSYLVHLSWLAFFAVALSVSAAVRWWLGTTSVRREIWLFAPVLVLLAWQEFAVPTEGAGNPPLYTESWGGVLSKLTGTLTEFRAFGGHVAELLMVLLGLCLFWPLRAHLRSQAWSKPAVLEHLAIAAAFFGVYIVLPRDMKYIAYIDIRALPMIFVFLILAVLHVPAEMSAGREFASRSALALAMLLALGNLVYLSHHLRPKNAWMENYRKVVQSVPPGAPVLSVYAGRQADQASFLHAHSFVVIDRAGLTPYLFSGDHSDPMFYFQFKHPYYRPPENWYEAQRVRRLSPGARPSTQYLGVDGKPWYETTAAPDWRRVACEYDYLLVTEPFQQDMIGLATRTVASNQSAALLQVESDKQNCPRGGVSDRSGQGVGSRAH